MRYHMRTLGRLAALLLFFSGLLGETPAEVHSAGGQILYVPVYSEIPHGDREHTLDLTVTLSIRNIDRKVAVTVRKVNYYNAKGELVRSYAQEPRVLSPLAAGKYSVNPSKKVGRNAPHDHRVGC